MNDALKAKAAAIDWTMHNGFAFDEIGCKCGAVYLSHTKGVAAAGEFEVVTRRPCPGCGETIGHVRRAHSAPERQTIGRRR